MTIKKKVLMQIALLFMVMLSVSTFISYTVILDSFNDLELENVKKQISLLKRTIEQEIDDLNSVNGDWAPWDDTYYFVKGENPDYTESNLDYATLANLRVDSMLFYGDDKKLVHSISIDTASEEETGLPRNIDAYLRDHNLFIQPGETSASKGLLIIDGRPLLFSSQPITTSSGENPAGRRLVMLRFFNEQEINYIESLLNKDLILLASDEIPGQLPNITQSEFLEQGHYISLAGNDLIRSFLPVQETGGPGFIVLEQEHSRDIYERGRHSIIFFLLLYFLLLISVSLVIVFVLNKTILDKILRLNAELRSIAKNNEFSDRVTISGTDEISTVQKNINETLEVLQKALAEKERTENELRRKTKDLEKANQELAETLEDFYTLRIGMQKDLEKNKVEEENKRIKKRLDELKHKT